MKSFIEKTKKEKTSSFFNCKVYKLNKKKSLKSEKLIWLRNQTEKDKLPTVTTLYLNHYNNDPSIFSTCKSLKTKNTENHQHWLIDRIYQLPVIICHYPSTLFNILSFSKHNDCTTKTIHF